MVPVKNTCGFCRYFGGCTTKNKSITSSRKKCKWYEELPESTQVPDILASIEALSFCEQNQIRKLLNAHIIQLAKNGLRVGQIVGFSAGETKGWVEGRITRFEGDKVYLQDANNQVWAVFPGFIDVMLKSEVDSQENNQGA